MSSSETVNALNQLLAIVCSSYPQYLHFSRPYIPPGHERVVDTLKGILADQDALIDRITEQIYDSDAQPDRGDFPLVYTDTHDLGLDYVVKQAIQFGQQDVAEVSNIVDTLSLAPAAKTLAEETLGTLKGHLQTLKELANSQAA